MRIFGIDNEDNFMDYKEQVFKESNKESLLEKWLEKNPTYILENQDLIIIGEQVYTNLNGRIDLLALNEYGDLVVVELKREKTPRETIAQILAYASFVDDLGFSELEAIYNKYMGDVSIPLDQYHKDYFSINENISVSYNKKQIFVIIGESISQEIRQTSTYLRKKGIDILCQEFRYFITKNGDKILSSEFVVNSDIKPLSNIASSSNRKITKTEFLEYFDEKRQKAVISFFDFLAKNDMPIVWGTKGLSINALVDGENVNFLELYPPEKKHEGSIWLKWEFILKKINNPEKIKEIISNIANRNNFISAGSYSFKKSLLKFIDYDMQQFYPNIIEIRDNVVKSGLIKKES